MGLPPLALLFVSMAAGSDNPVAWCAGPAGGLVLPAAPAAASGGSCGEGAVIDVLVVYTHAARLAAGGVAAIEAEIELMVEYNNVAWSESDVEATLNLVFAWQMRPGEGNIGLQQLTMPEDGVVDYVHALRDMYGADQVVLIEPGFFGIANGLVDLDPASAALAFCISGLDASPFVLSHEVGHNLGCCHAIGQGGGCPPEGGLLFPFSNGHAYTGDSGTFWGTVMAGGSLQRFSNPDVLFDGQPTGIEPGPDEIGADNATTVNIAAPVVADWRCNDGVCAALDLPSDADDCDGNGLPDACEVALGRVPDANDNGVPDVCECPFDATGDDSVDVEDLVQIVLEWGQPGGAGDVNHDGTVDVGDLVGVILHWGACS